jgi:hypothetical protein
MLKNARREDGTITSTSKTAHVAATQMSLNAAKLKA